MDIEALLELDDEEFVEAAYEALLARPPDPEGLGSYVEQLRSGTPKIALLAALALSAEGRVRSLGSSALASAVLRAYAAHRSMRAPEARTLAELLAHQDETFVRAAYLALMGREADDEGLETYLPELRAGAPKMRVLAALRRSAESARHEAALATAGAPARERLALLHQADRAISLHGLQRLPLLGRGIAAALGLERDDGVHARLRRIENLLHRIAGDTAPRAARPADDDAETDGPGNADHESGNAATLLRPAQSVAPLLSTLPTRPDR